jgi:hypothetical protein
MFDLWYQDDDQNNNRQITAPRMDFACFLVLLPSGG